MTSRRGFLGSLLSATVAPSLSPEGLGSHLSVQEATQSSHKRALVLSGGGIKGAFQAGAIAEILARGFVPDILVGTSIGALNAAFLVDRAGQKILSNQPVDWPSIGKSLEQFWHDQITGPDSIIDKKAMWKVGLRVLFTDFSGLIGIDPSIKLVKDTIQLQNVRAAKPLQLRVATVNVVNGELYLKDPGAQDFVEYVIASAAMPLVMPLIEIGGAPYTDGGIRTVAPVQAAIDLGADEIVCIVCQAKDLVATNFDQKNLLQLAGRLMDIVTNALVANDLERLQRESDLRKKLFTALSRPPQRTVKSQVIRPRDQINVDMESFTTQDIDNMIATGHYEVGKVGVRVDLIVE